jgi:hypothetical protein
MEEYRQRVRARLQSLASPLSSSPINTLPSTTAIGITTPLTPPSHNNNNRVFVAPFSSTNSNQHPLQQQQQQQQLMTNSDGSSNSNSSNHRPRLKRTRSFWSATAHKPDNALDALLFRAPLMTRQGTALHEIARLIWDEAKTNHAIALQAGQNDDDDNDQQPEGWFDDDLGSPPMPSKPVRFVAVEHPQVTLMYLTDGPPPPIGVNADYEKRFHFLLF